MTEVVFTGRNRRLPMARAKIEIFPEKQKNFFRRYEKKEKKKARHRSYEFTLTSWVSSSVPSPAGSSTDDSSSLSAASGAAVVVVVDCPGLGLRFILAPGLITGLTPVAGSRARAAEVGFGCAVASDSCAVSFVDSWLSSLPFGAVVVGLPRRRLMFSLKDGLDTPFEDEVDPPFDGVAVVDEATDLVDPAPRNLPRVVADGEGRSAWTELALSFCTASSSGRGGCFCPGRFLLKPPALEPLPPNRFRVRCVGSAGASVLVLPLPLPFDLNLRRENHS